MQRDSTHEKRAPTPKRPSRSSSADVRAIYDQLAVIESLLARDSASAELAVVPMFSAWEQVHNLLGQMGGTDTSAATETGQDAALAHIVARKEKWLPQLSFAFLFCCRSASAKMDRTTLMKCNEDLVLAANWLREYRTEDEPPSLYARKWLTRKHALVFGGIFVAIAAMGWGVSAILAPAPDEGLSAVYCDTSQVPHHCVERIDHSINFDWEEGSPIPALSANQFKIEWRGCINVPSNTSPVLIAGADDGIRIYVDDEKLIDDFKAGPYRENRAGKSLKPGIHRVRISYWENHSLAKAFVGWSIKGKIPRAIPPKYLIPAGGNRRFMCDEKKAPMPERANEHEREKTGSVDSPVRLSNASTHPFTTHSDAMTDNFKPDPQN